MERIISMKDYLKVSGKIAIVTGSAHGIGRGVAMGLASYGVKVMICDINDKDGLKVKEEILAAGGEAEYCHFDAFSSESINLLAKETVRLFGGIDILVNNVGGGLPSKGFEAISDEEWERIIRFNLSSTFYMCRAAFPYMKEKNAGKIVNISSGYSIGGGDYCAHYASAKAGIIGLTTSLAKEMAPYNINVNVIPVPTTDTPMVHITNTPEMIQEEVNLTPLGRIAVPEDIANTVLFLVSESANYVTGQIVAPNGGKRMLV